jgi:site-specific recombinase XerD
MTTNAYITRAKIRLHLQEGPLGVHIDQYAAQLLKEGHCRQSAWRSLRVVGDFSHWLHRKRLGLDDVDERTVDRYQQFRSRYRCPFMSDRPALLRLLAMLREIAAIAPKAPIVIGPLEQIEADFAQYLLQERGLARVSVVRHVPVVRQFLRERCAGGLQGIARLTAADITGFVERHARDHGSRSAQIMCWTLRAFARYLQYRGHITADLASAVPTVRNWRLASLPTYLLPKQVQQVLDACDRHSAIGRRDYAILMMLARLGLRANEIATLKLEDVDWQSGQITVRGKGRRHAQLPLLEDVGAAIADYLQYGRPRSDSRQVFLRDSAPHVGFTSSASVSMIAKVALARAGIDGVSHQCAHLFRHSLATQLLHAGASLTEIGQVLRHEDHDTTRIYAKVDIGALRTLGLRWPGGLR